MTNRTIAASHIMVANRIIASLAMIAFAFFLVVALDDIAQLVTQGQYGEVLLLVFCATVCVGWIAFLAAVALARAPARELEWHAPLPHG